MLAAIQLLLDQDKQLLVDEDVWIISTKQWLQLNASHRNGGDVNGATNVDHIITLVIQDGVGVLLCHHMVMELMVPIGGMGGDNDTAGRGGAGHQYAGGGGGGGCDNGAAGDGGAGGAQKINSYLPEIMEVVV